MDSSPEEDPQLTGRHDITLQETVAYLQISVHVEVKSPQVVLTLPGPITRHSLVSWMGWELFENSVKGERGRRGTEWFSVSGTIHSSSSRVEQGQGQTKNKKN